METNKHHFSLCEHCSLFKVEKITQAAAFFSSIRADSGAQSLSRLFETIFFDNVETLASVYNSLQSQNKERIRHYLREHSLDEAKIDELIVLSDERDGEDALFVRKLIKGTFQNYSDACRFNGSYKIQDTDLKSMCAASKRQLATRSRSPTINEINAMTLTEATSNTINETPLPQSLDVVEEKQNVLEKKNEANENGVLTESALPKDDAHNDAFQDDTHVPNEATPPQSSKKRAPRNKTKSKTTTTTTHESNEVAITRETRPRRKSIMPVSSVVEEATVAQKSTKRKRNSLPVSKKEREHVEAPPAKKLKNETKTAATASQLKRIEFDTNLEIIDEEHEPSTSQDADDEGGEEEDQNDGEEQMTSDFPYSVGDLVEAKDLKKNADIWYPAKVIDVNIDTKKVKIHFMGWNSRYDSFYPVKFDVLRPVKKEEANRVLSSVNKGRKPKVSLAKKRIEKVSQPMHDTPNTITDNNNNDLNEESNHFDDELPTTHKNKSKAKNSKPVEQGTTILTILQQKGVNQEAKETIKSANDEVKHSINEHESTDDNDSDAEYSTLTEPIQN